MSGGGPSGYTTSTKTAVPGGSASDYINQGLGFGANLWNQGSTYTGLNPGQISALNWQSEIANSGNPMLKNAISATGDIAAGNVNTAQDQNTLRSLAAQATDRNNPVYSYYNNVLAGKYLDPASNPWLSGTYDQAWNKVQGSVGSAMAGAGRYGSGAMSGTLADAGNNLATQIFGGAYQQERNLQNAAAGNYGALWNQGLGIGVQATGAAGNLANADRAARLQAAQLAPTLSEARYIDPAHLLQAGNAFQADADKWAQEPWQRLSNYMGLARGIPVGTTTTESNPYYDNTTGQILGTGMGVASLLNTIGGNGTAGNLLGQGASLLGSGISNLYNSFTTPSNYGGYGAPDFQSQIYSTNYNDPAAMPDIYGYYPTY